jgi:hypothetical protein
MYELRRGLGGLLSNQCSPSALLPESSSLPLSLPLAASVLLGPNRVEIGSRCFRLLFRSQRGKPAMRSIRRRIARGVGRPGRGRRCMEHEAPRFAP